MTFETPVQKLPKVGPKLTTTFKQLGILTVGDLLYHFPYKYLDFSNNTAIGNLVTGETVTITATIDKIKAQRSFKSRLSFSTAKVFDDTGNLEVIWFNQPYISKSYKTGDDVYLAGTVTAKANGKIQLVNPVIEKFSEQGIHTGRIIPVYHSVEIVHNKTLRNLVDYCLKQIAEWPETLPAKIIKKHKLISLKEAIQALHFPNNWQQINYAKLRIAIDDLLPLQLAVEVKQQRLEAAGSFPINTNIETVKHFIAQLSFALTDSQKRAAWDILQDLNKTKPMNRLLQGEVGSGKTVVMAIAALQTYLSNLQTAVIAPTEILAKQHFETFLKLFSHQKSINIALLTRSAAIINDAQTTKTTLLKKLKTGEINILIGTHAVLQPNISFKRLALMIIDEQHRFGVAQRSYLKEALLDNPPHLLSVSATPIPRTLALSVYGNLDVSDLKQMPTGRKPVITKLITENDRDKLYHFLAGQIAQGRQAFVVTPRIEDSEKSELKAAKQEFDALQKVFAKLRIGLLHGKMKAQDKDLVASLFTEGKLDILVATSVIEIGVDFPNANVIVIEGAERFGLSQLHQLRGRVGRGLSQSYCFLLTTSEGHQNNHRLEIFAKTFDGFKLAEEDLKQRGFGDLFGSMQSGFNFRFPKFITEEALLVSKKIAQEFIHNPKTFPNHQGLLQLAEDFSEGYHGE